MLDIPDGEGVAFESVVKSIIVVDFKESESDEKGNREHISFNIPHAYSSLYFQHFSYL